MAAREIGKTSPSAGVAYYLDTSALFALSQLQVKKTGGQADTREITRAKKVTDFALRAKKNKAIITTTVLAFEELAALANNRLRKAEAKLHGFGSWRDLKVGDPAQASASESLAHQGMLMMLKNAADATGPLGVLNQWPQVDEDTSKAGRRLRKAHRQLLQQYAGMDAMDALHIVVGAELGIRSFISFDQGWAVVPTIDVLA